MTQELQLPEWYQFLQPRIRQGRARALIDHLANVGENERLDVTGAYIVPGAKFTITSDAFAMVNFVDQDGNHHPGAFWGEWDDTVRLVDRLADYLGDEGGPSGEDMGHALQRALRDAIGINYAYARN